jgi:hypothetical protein
LENYHGFKIWGRFVHTVAPYSLLNSYVIAWDKYVSFHPVPDKVNKFFIFQYHGQIAEECMCGNFIFYANKK